MLIAKKSVNGCLSKVFSHVRKALTYLIVSLSLFSIITSAFGEYYQTTYTWGFLNDSYFSFNQAMDFTNVPHQGVAQDNSLVGYWNMNEGSGTIAHDSSGNGNNGTITGASWVNGKYGQALIFNGSTDYVLTSYSSALNFGKGPFSFGCWVTFEAQSSGEHVIMRGDNEGSLRRSLFSLVWASSGTLKLACYDSTLSSNQTRSISKSVTVDGNLHFIMGSRDGDNLNLYIDAKLAGSTSGVLDYNINSTNQIALGRYEGSKSAYLKGIVDEVRVYNRALSSVDISTLYVIGPEPDSVSFANYYSFSNLVTNNTMLIYADSPSANSTNSALFTCTNFFVNNGLVFRANNSASVNVWTNLGQPEFTTGVWNSQNYTTTLTLDASSTAELDWNQGTPPSASNLSASSTIASKTAAFSALWSDDHSLSGGGFIFSTNNTGNWVNASWAPFSSTPCWGNGTLTLNSNVGAIVDFRGYANNSLNLWGDSGIYAITTINDTPAPIPITVPTASPTPMTSPTPTPTENPTPTPTTNQTDAFPTQTTLSVVISVVAALVAVFALAFKKGYVTFEVVDAKCSEENAEDFSI